MDIDLQQQKRENDRLRKEIRELRRQNEQLKHSVFRLSTSLNAERAAARALRRESAVGPALLGDTSLYSGDREGVAGRNGAAAAAAVASGGAGSTRSAAAAAATDVLQPKFQFQSKSVLRGHTGAVYTCRFSPCGNFLASGSFDCTVRVWSLAARGKAGE